MGTDSNFPLLVEILKLNNIEYRIEKREIWVRPHFPSKGVIMRIVFMGTPDFARESLKAIYEKVMR